MGLCQLMRPCAEERRAGRNKKDRHKGIGKGLTCKIGPVAKFVWLSSAPDHPSLPCLNEYFFNNLSVISPSTLCVSVLQEFSDSYWRVSKGHEQRWVRDSMLWAEAAPWVTAWMSADGSKHLYLPNWLCTRWACGSVGELQAGSTPGSGRPIR